MLRRLPNVLHDDFTGTIYRAVPDVQAPGSDNAFKRKPDRSARRGRISLTKLSIELDRAYRLPFVSIQDLGYCATHLSMRETYKLARSTAFSSGHAIP